MSGAGILHAAPRPFIDESLASWLQRICARHACSMYWLTQFLELPRQGDIDLDLSSEHLRRLDEVTGMAADWIFLVDYHDMLRAKTESKKIYRDLASRKYKWCAMCFFEDRDPYFRQSWRFGPAVCLVHGTPLTSECPGCGRGANLGRTCHRGGGVNMAHCRHCGHWLGRAPVRDLRQGRTRALWLPIVDLAVRDIRLEFAQRVQAVQDQDRSQEPFSYPARHPLEFPNLNEYPAQLEWRIARNYRMRQPVLMLDSRQFARPDRMIAPRRKWSSAIPRGAVARSIMAAALIVFRNEVRVNRREGQS